MKIFFKAFINLFSRPHREWTLEEAFAYLEKNMPPGETFCVERELWRNQSTPRVEHRVSLFSGASLPVQRMGVNLELTVKTAVADYRR